MEYISQSMLNTFYRCPEQFRRRYIDGEILPPGIAARKGSATHKAAEINHQHKIATKSDMSLGDLQDAARDEYVRLVKEEGVFIPKEEAGETKKLLADGLDSTVRLTKVYREKVAPQIQPILVEEIIYLDAGLSLPLRGIVDVVTEKEGGKIHLPDLKTTAKAYSQGTADSALQLTFYGGLVAERLGQWPDSYSLEIMIDNSKSYHQSLTTSRTKADWEILMMRIENMLEHLKAGLFHPCDPGHWCHSPKWCGFFWSCKYANK